MGSLLSKGFYATLATKFIKISAHLSERYPLIRLDLSVEDVPAFPLNHGRLIELLHKFH